MLVIGEKVFTIEGEGTVVAINKHFAWIYLGHDKYITCPIPDYCSDKAQVWKKPSELIQHRVNNTPMFQPNGEDISVTKLRSSIGQILIYLDEEAEKKCN